MRKSLKKTNRKGLHPSHVRHARRARNFRHPALHEQTEYIGSNEKSVQHERMAKRIIMHALRKSSAARVEKKDQHAQRAKRTILHAPERVAIVPRLARTNSSPFVTLANISALCTPVCASEEIRIPA